MPNWQAIIVGDAFKLKSRDPRYYADMALMWPTLLFGSVLLGTISRWPPVFWGPHGILLWTLLLAACLVLLEERVVILAGCLGAVAVFADLEMLFHPAKISRGLGTMMICVLGILVLLWPNRFRTEFWGWKGRVPRGMDIAGLLCNFAGFGIAILVIRFVH